MRCLKRISVFLLIATLLLSAIGPLSVFAETENGLPIAFDSFAVRGVRTVSSVGTLLAGAELKPEEPIDLAAYGYPTDGSVIPTGKLALQMDVYLSGDEALCTHLENGRAIGQIEITSSGRMDREERHGNVSLISWKTDAWQRVWVDLGKLSGLSNGPFDPSNFNYLRIYINGLTDFVGCSVKLSILNLCLVDLTETDTTVQPDLLGDGTFAAAPPTKEAVVFSDDYCADDTVVASYNVADYVKEHPSVFHGDYAPVLQSLADSLSLLGGGTIFLPAGVYPCYSEFTLTSGVRLYGEWQSPETHSTANGTVLAVYTGKDSDLPFITMQGISAIQNVSFWYPEQTLPDVVAYAPTVQVYDNTLVKNVTFWNAYRGITSSTTMFGCADLTNIYGTPLACGAEMDYIADLSRWENIVFSPRFWAESALENTPARAAIEAHLYEHACGIRIRRVDWSYLMYSAVEGYRVGLQFAPGKKADGTTTYPNGQCYGLTFTRCHTAVEALALSPSSESIANLTVTDCVYGVAVKDGSDQQLGCLKLLDADIAADTALHLSEKAQVSLLSSTVRRGVITATSGWLSVMNTTFLTGAPQVRLENGALAAVLRGNTDANGDPIAVHNPAQCNVSMDAAPAAVETIPTVSAEDGLSEVKRPRSTAVTVAALDTRGVTDVTEELNRLLQAQAVTGGTVFLPSGQYRLDGTVNIPSGVQLLGENDFGHSSAKVNYGTVLCIYGDADSAVIMKSESGLRGITLWYPEQGYDNGTFRDYPHAVRGEGADIYIINVTGAVVQNGVDLMTNRCDRHYVEALRGAYLGNMISVGGGAVDGTVRNCHLHQANIMYRDYGWCEWPQGMDQAAWRDTVRAYTQINMVVYRVGHVINELIYGCFSYSGYSGIAFVPEASGAAEALLLAHGVDYGTVAVDVQAAKRLDFINLQETAFNQLGDTFTEQMSNIRLGKAFGGTVNVFGGVIYETPQTMFDLQNGRLNLYGIRYRSSSPAMAQLSETARLYVADGYFGHYGSITQLPTTQTNPQNLHIDGGFYTQPLLWGDTLGTFQHLQRTVTTPNHRVEEHPGRDATCIEEGLTVGYWCVDCKAYVYGAEVIPPHQTELRDAVPPTAVKPGRAAGMWCTVCERYIFGGEEVPPYGRFGDVDGSGKVNSTDARLVLQFAVGKITEQALDSTAADVDGNGRIDSTDARLILQYAVNKIDVFPIT